MIKGSEIRKAGYPIEPLLIDRWSPRAMSGEEISEEELMRLFEAARWAPSSFNAQQWRALYARRGTEHWQAFFDLLVDANKVWAKTRVTTSPACAPAASDSFPSGQRRARKATHGPFSPCQRTAVPNCPRRHQRNRNPLSRQISTKLSRPPLRRRENCGRTSHRTRAEIGSTGSPPPSNQRRARAGSRMPARCSRPGSDAFAASTAPGSTAKV